MTADHWKQIEELYEAARNLDANERTDFLIRACNGNESLRHGVESMFAAEKVLGSFLSDSTFLDTALQYALSPEHLIGTKLNHYQLLSLIGIGGMGEVYEAEDTRLRRKVAIKLLPEAVSNDPEWLRRFEREARAIGMLNHPNILTIYDVGEHDGRSYIVMERLEGELLRDRITDRTISVAKAINIGLQLSRGLAAAHEQGIAHRDLKPENIYITREGWVKILDFGLAKITPSRNADGAILSSGIDNLHSPHPQLSTPGRVLGTIGYTAPEQLQKQKTDYRVDLFAFGVVMYEMLVGERPFVGKTSAETINAILEQDPPALPAAVTSSAPDLERLVRRCLEKKPEQRFQSARDLGFALEMLAASCPDSNGGLSSLPSRSLQTEPPGAVRFLWPRKPWMNWVLASLLLLILTATGIFSFQSKSIKEEVSRFSILLPEHVSTNEEPVISPDGRRLIFHARSEGKVQIWVRPINASNAQVIPGTENGTHPFWSPDSRQIGFFADGKLKIVGLSGELPVTLCQAPMGVGGTWSQDGVILFVPDVAAGIYRISASGGTAEPVPGLEKRSGLFWPCFLPDGRHFLYFTFGHQKEENGVYLASIDSGKSTRLLSSSSSAVYAPPGYLLFVQNGALMAQAFDADNLKLTGRPVPVLARAPGAAFGKAFLSVSQRGIFIYSPRADAANAGVIQYDRTGKSLGPMGPQGEFYGASLSPDEKHAAFMSLAGQFDREGAFDIWVHDLKRNSHRRFTFNPADDVYPLWNPSGAGIAWVSVEAEASRINYQPTFPETGSSQLLLKSDRPVRLNDWSQDGKFILYEQNNLTTQLDLYVLPVGENADAPYPWAQSPFNETYAQLSPDARWLAWTSDETGNAEVYVQDFQKTGGRWKISAAGGMAPIWRKDGKEMYYISTDNKLMAVEIKTSSEFTPGPARPLFNLPDLRVQLISASPDGRRFLLFKMPDLDSTNPFEVILNWTALLE